MVNFCFIRKEDTAQVKQMFNKIPLYSCYTTGHLVLTTVSGNEDVRAP